MKKLHIFITLAALGLTCLSCLKGTEEYQEVSGPHFTLTLQVPGSNVRSLTKADMPNGVKSLNENKVKSVYYFFFQDTDESATAQVSGHFVGLNLDGEQSSQATKTWQVPVSVSVVAKLFPSGSRKCRMFIVANPPEEIISKLEAKSPTLGYLRSLPFTSSLAGTQDSFVMVCDDLVEAESRTGDNAFTAQATLKRVANKVSVKVFTVNKYIDPESKDEWIPLIDGLKVEFNNGINKANLSGDFSKLSVSDDDYFISASGFSSAVSYNYSAVEKTDILAAITDTLSASTSLPVAGEDAPQYVVVDGQYYSLLKSSTSTTPIYTYPMTWDFAGKREPFLMLELPWERTYMAAGEKHTETRSTFYKLTLSRKSMSINGWYNISVDLKVVGSFYKEDPVEEFLYEDYFVLDWNDAFTGADNNVDADVKDAHYLVVPETEFVINNQSRLSIPFSSSHNCDVTVISCSHESFASNTPDEVGDKNAAQNWFHFNGAVLEFEHELDNTLGPDMDYTPYVIELYIYHKDQSGAVGAKKYQERIKITQYPSIYLELERGGNTDNTQNPTVYVNNSQADNAGWMYTYNQALAATGSNSNPNMYVVNVSALDAFQLTDGSYATIGDPRISTSVNASTGTAYMGTWNPTVASANYWDYTSNSVTSGNTKRTLQDYYPTDKSDATKTIIAPKFRTNSASGQTNGNSYTLEEATRRCAAYQQDGYPAGRWRLPTNAEMEFITKLCALGVVPAFFNDGKNYWSATDLYKYSSSTGTVSITNATSERFCRCVYDEWYWDIIDKEEANTHTTKTFYWGDKAR